MLVARGALTAQRLSDALAIQRAHGGRLGEILVRRGWCDPRALAQTAADQAGVALIDPEAAPIDPTLTDPAHIPRCVARRVAPWRRIGGEVVLVAADADAAERALREAGAPPGRYALAEPAALARALAAAFAEPLAARASERAPLAVSARAPMPAGQRAGFAVLALLIAASFALAPAQAGASLFLLLVGLNALNAAARIAVLGFALRAPSDPELRRSPGVATLSAARARPRITLLIPLLREPEAMPTLLEALERIDWPRDLLDVKLILEHDDGATRAALERLGVPPFASVLVAPPGGPRTKPRALNFALDFAEGEIVGIYDAEDQPEPDQLTRVADILREAGPEVACVQCRLAYYNPRENWLTRCFFVSWPLAWISERE
ncbi:MAG: glycosyltransferase [Rubrimonas sp.]